MKNKKEILNYFLVIFVLIMQVTVFFDALHPAIQRGLSLFTFLLLMLFYLVKKTQKIEVEIFIFTLCVLLLISLHGFYFGFSIHTFVSYPTFVLLTPYLLYKIIGPSVFKYLVNVIYYTAIAASMIWVLQVMIDPFDQLLQQLRTGSGYFFVQGTENNNRVSIAFLYTISHWQVTIFGFDILRNSGLYHEPGAFAYFLIIAIGINTIIQKDFFNKKNIIMSIILLTTFSTAGYLSFFIMLIFGTFKTNMHPNYKAIVILLVVILMPFMYINSEFMHDKIARQAYALEDDDVFQGRGWRVRSAINLLSTSPIIGRGIITESRDYEFGSPYYFSGAGIWRALSSYGLLFSPVIIYLFYAGIRKMCFTYRFDRSFAIFFIIAISIGATSQRFFMDNITMLILINGLIFKTYNMYNKRLLVR